MSPEQFRFLIEELATENPLAIRPFLRVLEVCFTSDVATLAVTKEARPRLLVNLRFLDEHCRTDAQVKAVILHEFLHILLRHTEKQHPSSPAEHLAMDAVINAIIHRQVGSEASSMMQAYYASASGMMRLLRPRTDAEEATSATGLFDRVWDGLYAGFLIVDDIEDLAEQLSANPEPSGGDDPGNTASGEIVLEDLLGNHKDFGTELPEAMKEALDSSLRAMNGGGIWRSPFSRGAGANPYETRIAAETGVKERWLRQTLAILRRHVVPDRHSPVVHGEVRPSFLPVLSPNDRRAFLRATWSAFLPEAEWRIETPQQYGTAQVYLDVSGSMDAEMPMVIALLNRLRRHIKMPFWAFSTEVQPAVIRQGVLVTTTTGGTSIECVLQHIARTRPVNAVIVTDGYIERVDPKWVMETKGTRVHAIVTRNGSTNLLDQAGLTCSQLEEVPK